MVRRETYKVFQEQMVSVFFWIFYAKFSGYFKLGLDESRASFFCINDAWLFANINSVIFKTSTLIPEILTARVRYTVRVMMG